MMCWLGVLLFSLVGASCIIAGFLKETVALIVVGVGVILIGFLICWVSVFVLYGFGQLVENSDKIEKRLSSLIENDARETQEDKKKVEGYFNSKWQEDIKSLSDEELRVRMGSEDWQPEYRELCEKELNSRK
jgi:Na+-transporting methylmalonyl-CoA/oxaloacetate decarboxylase gamma subunit